MIFIMISFCRKKKYFFAEFYFPDSICNVLVNSCFYEKKHLKKAYLFLGLEHDPSPFRRQEHMENIISRILLQKAEGMRFWLPNRKIIKIPHFWSKHNIFAPMAPTLINVTVFLVFWDPFSSFSDFGGKSHHFSAKSLLAPKNHKVAPSSLKVVHGIVTFRLEKSRRLFCE